MGTMKIQKEEKILNLFIHQKRVNILNFFSRFKLLIIGTPLLTLLLILSDILLIGNTVNYFEIIPVSISDWISSRWVFFFIFSLFIINLWNAISPKGSKANDYVKFLGNHISVPSMDVVLVVFECKPPLINQLQELKFLTTAFRPLSIEVHWKASSFYLILYGNEGKKFQLKTKECLKVLETNFTKVIQLKTRELNNFFNSKYANNQSFESNDNGFYSFDSRSELKKILKIVLVAKDNLSPNMNPHLKLIDNLEIDLVIRFWFVNRKNIIKKDEKIEEKYFGGEIGFVNMSNVHNKFDNNKTSPIPQLVINKLRLTPKMKVENLLTIGEKCLIYFIYKWIISVSSINRGSTQNNLNLLSPILEVKTEEQQSIQSEIDFRPKIQLDRIKSIPQYPQILSNSLPIPENLSVTKDSYSINSYEDEKKKLVNNANKTTKPDSIGELESHSELINHNTLSISHIDSIITSLGNDQIKLHENYSFMNKIKMRIKLK